LRTRGPASIYIALKGASSLFAALVYTVELVYLAQTVRLSPFQLVLAGTIQQAVSFLFQAPTGALADMYSRRGAVVAGFALVGAGFLLEGTIPALACVLAAQALYGLGATLVDGADAAWIADELGAEHAGPIYLRATQIGWLATLPGIALSAALGSLRLSLPIVCGGTLYFALAAVLALVMPETRFTPTAHELGSPWRQMGRTVHSGLLLVRLRPVLLSVLGAAALVGVFGASFGQLWQYHLLHTFTFPRLGALAPVVWFGIIEAVIALTSVVGIEIARRRVATTSHRAVAWALLAASTFTLAGALCFALAGWFALALAGLWLVTTAAGPRIPLENAWMNQSLDANVRATVFSVRSQVQSLAAIAGGPLIGALATAFGTRPALVAAGLVLAPALLLYARALRLRAGLHAAPL
jgi:DHA3 family tetracycline resistance protein-like MFS transporter